ncbi:MAG: transglutaminase domain-containing protein, partial [Thermoanaerobaculia bacterium]
MRTKKNRSWTRPIAVLLTLAALLSSPSWAAAPSERWYLLSLAGQPVGSVQESLTGAEASLVTESRLQLTLNRLGKRVEIASASTSRESGDGRLVATGLDLKMSDQTTSVTAEIADGAVRVRSRAGGQSFERTLSLTGELLGPEGIRQRTLARLLKAGDTFQVQTFSPELGTVATVVRTVLGHETLTIAGRQVPALKLEETYSGLPSKRTLWLDAEGRMLASEDPGPFGVLRSVLADEATARHAGEAGGELPAEAYTGTIARTQVRLPSSRRLEWLKLRIDHRDPSLGWPDLDRPGQKVTEKTESSLVVEISRPQPPTGPHAFPVAPTEALREYLEPNAYVQSNEAALRAKALAIVGGEKDLLSAALKLKRWVAETMQFDLGIAMAPSVEIFKNHRGTCVGYATLLTTLARAVGIPSRMALGYAYADGMFGGHAWTEVLVGETWVPLDAALVGPGVADAARFAILESSLRDGVGPLNSGPALQMYGHIGVRVLGYAAEGGPRHAVASDASAYTVAGDVYRNPELGIALWQSLPRFRGDSTERTFVFRIAHNRGLTHRSRRRPDASGGLEAAA